MTRRSSSEEERDEDAGTLRAEKELAARTRFLNVWAAIGIVALVLIAAKAVAILGTTMAILLVTLIIIFCLRGVVDALEARGMRRIWATSVAFVLMLVVLLLVGLVMFSPAFGLGGQIDDFLHALPTYIDDINALSNDLYNQYADLFRTDVIQQWMNDALASLSEAATGMAQTSVSGLVSVGAGVMNAGLVILFALVISFWILLDLPAIGRECERIIDPKYREDAEMLHITVSRVMNGFIRGTLLQSAIVGIAAGVWFVVIGMPNPAALGVIMALVNIVPVVGPWVGGVIAAVMGLFAGPFVALLAVIGFICIHFFVAMFVYPRIMQGSVDAHPALVLVAIMAGSALGGAGGGVTGALVGMLLSIPIVAMAKSVFVYYFEKRTGRRIVSPDGVFFKGGEEGDDDVADPMRDATADHPPVRTTIDEEVAGLLAKRDPRLAGDARAAGDPQAAGGVRPEGGAHATGDGRPAGGAHAAGGARRTGAPHAAGSPRPAGGARGEDAQDGDRQE